MSEPVEKSMIDQILEMRTAAEERLSANTDYIAIQKLDELLVKLESLNAGSEAPEEEAIAGDAATETEAPAEQAVAQDAAAETETPAEEQAPAADAAAETEAPAEQAIAADAAAEAA